MLRLVFTSLFLASLGTAAQAAVVTADVPLCNLAGTVAMSPTTSGGVSTGVRSCSISIPKFDAATGTLTSVTLETTVGAVHTVSVANSSSTAQPIRVSFNTAVGITSSDPAFGGSFAQDFANDTATSSAPYPVPGNGGFVLGERRYNDRTYTTLFTGADAQGFVGTGSASLDFRTIANIGFLDAAGNAVLPPPSLSFTDVISEIDGIVRVTFNYDAASGPASPVPAPGALCLLLTGLGAGAFIRRRRKA
jgi:hypothetical protein